MLKHLAISNFKLINHLECDFTGGLTVLTGETGAGKSIILSALTTLLGDKPNPDIFHDETLPITISAIFALPPNQELHSLLDQLGFADKPDEIILRRHISRKSQGSLNNRIYLNDQPTTGATAAALTAYLIEFVDQHQQQSLRDPKEPLRLLDAFGAIDPLKREYENAYREYQASERHLEKWQAQISQAARQTDYYSHQLKELNEARLDPAEEEELTAQRRQYLQIGKLQELAREAEALSYSDSNSIIDSCYRLLEISSELSRRDSSAPRTAESLTGLIDNLQDIYRENCDYLSRLDIDEQTIEETEARLALLERLKRKFAVDLNGLIELRQELEQRIAEWENRDAEKIRLEQELAQKRVKALKLAEKLSLVRQEQAEIMAGAVTAHLKELNLGRARFLIRREESAMTPSGGDKISFCFSANPGEEPAPLAEIASGGELSRLLLSLKTTVANRFQLPTMIFDEVDTGLGGGTAAAVGRKIAAIAKNCQVLTVTHLPQVAAFADQHIIISKTSCPEKEQTTIGLTEIGPLQEAARIRELARMGSGEEITKEAEEHARALLKEARKETINR
ncbi:MAG: DNA repair protein RecN [Deltaproteobacteria bacterium]|nr:DNA repair protein RecN [Deltaproteobacteria bacterium]